MPLGPISQPGASARLPDVPTSISATAVSGGQASVSFVASTNPGKGSGNYVVTSSPGSLTASSASSPITVTGLTTGTAYTFTVVKQSGSGISSATSGASGSITAYVPPTFGTQTGSSSASAPSGGSTTGISNVYTTTGTLSKSIGAGATFYDYERISGTGGGASGDSLSGLAEDTNHEWRVRVTNTISTFALTTRVTPNGSTTTVSVEYGTDGSYGTSAGSVSIGAGLLEVVSSWSLGSSTSATIHWRVTATYAGGASVQTTGTISRAVTVHNGTSTGVFRTYTTRTTTGYKLVSKPDYGANITINSYTLVGGGGAGGNQAGAFLGYGGGGGGDIKTGSSISTTSFLLSSPGPGGSKSTSSRGTASTLAGGSFATITAGGGYAATGNYQGGSSGNGNAGFAGGSSIGGGGGGAGGAASDINGGSGYFGVSPGGPGLFNTGFSSGYGSYVNGAEGNYGAGGKSNFDGANGYTEITWVGPA